MRRTPLAGAGIAIGALTLAIGTAQSAAAQPVAGCGSQDLMTVQAAIDAVDWRIYSPEERELIENDIRDVLDANRDGYLCVKQFKPNRGQDKHWGAEDYIVTGISDNKAVGRV